MFHFLAPNIELVDHMQEIIGQKPHLQAGLAGLEALSLLLVGREGNLFPAPNNIITASKKFLPFLPPP